MSGRGRIAGLLSLIIAVGSGGFGSVAKSEIVIQGTVPRSPSNGCLANVKGLRFKEQVSKLSTMLFKDDLAIRRFLDTHCAIVISVVSEGEDASRCTNSLGNLLYPKVEKLKKMVGDEAKFCIFMGEYKGAVDINVLLDLGTEDDWDKNIPPTLMDELAACPQREYMVFTKNLSASNYHVRPSKGHKKRKFLWQKTRDFKFDYSSRTKPGGDWSRILTADGLIYFVYKEASATKAKTNCLLDTDACSQSDDSDSSNISIPEEGPFRPLVSNYPSPVNRNKSISGNNRKQVRLVRRTVTVTEEYYEEEYDEEKSDPDDGLLTSLRLGLLTKNALHFS